MLELRHVCEHCRKSLPPNSMEAMICSFECTFCSDCVDKVLSGICPNCGGNFSPRPIRPSQNLKGENYLGKYPAGTTVKYRPVDVEAHRQFAQRIAKIAPQDR